MIDLPADPYDARRVLAYDIGHAIREGDALMASYLLHLGKPLGIDLYGQVGKRAPKMSYDFFAGNWRDGLVTYPAVVYVRPDGSRMVLSTGLAWERSE